jgi:GAF domain
MVNCVDTLSISWNTPGAIAMNTCFPSMTFRSLLLSTDGQENSFSMLLSDLMAGIKETADLAGAIETDFIQVCEATDWDYGEIWIPSDNSTILELSPVWHIASDAADFTSLEQFRLCSEGCILSPGEGLPGRVWLSGESEWIADATAYSESYWLRHQLAKAFDIRAGFGVPLITNGQTQAVLAFFKLGTPEIQILT